MAGVSLISRSIRKFLIVSSALLLVVALSACHRHAPIDTNINANSSSSGPIDPAEAKRQAQTLIDQGKELYKNDQDEQAVKVFKQAAALDQSNPEAHLRLGMAYAALEQKVDADESYKKAIDLYKKKIQTDSGDAEAFFNLAEAYSFMHLDEEAAHNYRQATRVNPKDEEGWYRLGMTETKLAQYPEAISAFQKALELDPNDSRATDGLQSAQEGAQRIKEGKKHAEDMLKKQQQNTNVNGNLNANSSANPKPSPKRSPRKLW